MDFDMMSDWERDVLIPSIDIQAELGDMEFRTTADGGMVSVRHLDGSQNRQGTPATYIYPNNSGWAIDHTRGESKPVVNMIAERRGMTYWETVRALAGEHGLELPDGTGEHDWDMLRKQRELDEVRRSAAEAARSMFAKAIQGDSAEAVECRKYLAEGRGMTDEDLRTLWGEGRGYGLCTLKLIDELLAVNADARPLFCHEGSTGKRQYIDGRIGTQNILAIPWYSYGVLRGLKFRILGNLTGRDDTRAKYLNANGMKVGGSFFCLSQTPADIIAVEGETAVMKAYARGMRNVVAVAGSGGAKPDQLRDAVRHGVRSVTVLMDGDEAGRKETEGSLRAAAGIRELQMFVAEFPDGIKDLDEFLDAGHGVDEVNALAAAAVTPAVWRARNEIRSESGGLDDARVRERLLKDRLFRIWRNAPATDRDGIISEAVAGLRCDPDALRADYAEMLGNAEADDARDDMRAKALQIAQHLAAKNDVAADRLIRELADAKGAKAADRIVDEEFPHLSDTDAAREGGDRAKGRPTGYRIGKARLTIGTGITLICGNRGHGKTTMLNNLCVNELKRIRRQGTGERVLYLSYEIKRGSLLNSILRTYINDPFILSQVDTIRHYMAAYGRGDDYTERVKFVPGDMLWEGFDLTAEYPDYGRKAARDISHKEYVDRMASQFLREYIDTDALKIGDLTLTAGELLAVLRKEMARYPDRPVGIVYADYTQLIYPEEKQLQRTEQLKDVLNRIRNFSEEMNVPFVMAAQFNRQVNSPAGVLTNNIGEAGDLERVADTIVGLYNLKELRQPLAKNSGEEREIERLIRLSGLELPVEMRAGKNGVEKKTQVIGPIEGRMFAAMLKRRFGDFPCYDNFKFVGQSGHIEQNDLEAADRIPDSDYGLDREYLNDVIALSEGRELADRHGKLNNKKRSRYSAPQITEGNIERGGAVRYNEDDDL